MSVVTWDHTDNSNTRLSEKQLESVYLLSSLDCYSNEQVTLGEAKTCVKDEETDDVVCIQLASHFYSWLWSLEKNMDSETSQSHRVYIEYITSRIRECRNILNTVDDILLNLATLDENYCSIAHTTNEMHELCEHLLKQQNELTESASTIESYLVHFTYIDQIQSDLIASNLSTSRERIVPLLDGIDCSITFLKSHFHYKEAPMYLSRAKEVLLKVLGHIKFTVKKIVEGTFNELSELHDVITPDNSFILLYGRFRSQGPKIRSLMSVMEERIHITNEYQLAISECHKFYLKHREELLASVATNGMNDLVQKYSADRCALIRTAGAFLSNMCEDEVRLFTQFFAPQFSTAMCPMLSKLCRCLYDAIRPLIIHINHIEILSELCDIIKFELTMENKANNRPDISAFNDLCLILLADIQERLVFRSHIYIKSEIMDYVSSPGDLSYPEKLEMMDNIARTVSSTTEKCEKSENEANPDHPVKSDTNNDLSVVPGPNMSLAPADLYGMWYPTVRRALVCLSKLSRCLDSDSFRGLAQECVAMCVQSLIKASDDITMRRTSLDGQLFLIKHLLILREQMAPFNVEFLVKETSLDFSTYKNVALSIWERKVSALFTLDRNNALLRFLLETPNAIDVEVDSRRQLDAQLKHVCELLIEQQVVYLTGDLSHFVKQAQSVLTVADAKLTDCTFANVSLLKEMVSSAHHLIRTSLGRAACTDKSVNLRKHLHTYLANPDTENILLRRIQSGVLTMWKSVHRLLDEHYTEEDRLIVACPTESQIRLLFQDVWIS